MRYVYVFGSAAAITMYVAGDLLSAPMNQIRALFIVLFLSTAAAFDWIYSKAKQ